MSNTDRELQERALEFSGGRTECLACYFTMSADSDELCPTHSVGDKTSPTAG